jgi:hypothetical protein
MDLLQKYTATFLLANKNYFNNLNMVIASKLRTQKNTVPAYNVKQHTVCSPEMS